MVWPFYNSFEFQQRLEDMGIARRLPLGEGELVFCDIFDSVNAVDRALREETDKMLGERAYGWYLEAEKHFC